MAYGLTDNGFEIKRLDVIKAELEVAFTDIFGEIDVSAESVFGQIIGIISKTISDNWEIMEAVYGSQYPASAQGFSLDNVAQLIGVVRLPATKTIVHGVVIGVYNTIIPEGTQAKVSTTGEIFEVKDNDVTIDYDDSIYTEIEVQTITNSSVYTVTINSTAYNYTSDADATAEEIALGLVTKINTDCPDADATDNLDGTFYVQASDNETPYTIAVEAKLLISNIGTPAIFEAINFGKIVVPIGALDTIETPVSGWNDVNNLVIGIAGRDVETDPDLRIRMAESANILGAGTVEAIRSRILQDVADVTACTVVENRTNIIDCDGRPPHSFEAIVSGGADQDIGDKIWEVKPAGINTHKSATGGVSVFVTDSMGNTQEMKFSRPTNKYAWIEVDLILNPEESFPVNGLSDVAQNILAYGNTLGIGDDVLTQRFYTPIFETPGIASAVIRTALTDDLTPPGSYTTADKAIASNEIAIFDITRITIITV